MGLTSQTGSKGSPYIFGNKWFWLRATDGSSGRYVLGALTGDCVNSIHVLGISGVVPSCALDLSSVVFASAATPAENNATLKDGVYLRFKGGTLINSTATITRKQIKVTKGSESSTIYLYVQSNDGREDWVYSKQIIKDEMFNAEKIHTDLTNFSNCQVWLETTKDCVTYAKSILIESPISIKSYINVNDLTNNSCYGLYGGTGSEISILFEKHMV